MYEPNKRIPYSTDLSDGEWEKIEPCIPQPKTKRGRKREHSFHEILNAIFYLLRSGCVWRLLPHDFPPWQTVYHYFRLWRINGVWECINASLRIEIRTAECRNPESSAVVSQRKIPPPAIGLSKDYEGLPETIESMIYAAMIHLMIRRLARI